MVQASQRNALHELGYKIFLDRYAQKDMTRSTLTVGDTVIVVVDPKTGQREIGRVTAMNLPKVTIELLDGEVVERDLENVDKPLETDPGQMMDRVAAGIAAIEATPELKRAWSERFRWLLDDWKFVPGGRILTAAGTDQKLSYYNCYVLDLPRDSRGGILKTLGEMTEIMSRGGGVGITLSSLRPRHAYVKGVNGRSSGSVSWGALYSFVTGLIEQGGSRRGALLLLLADWHPDVIEFINSKRKAGHITNANISVAISDKFMQAVKEDGDWTLRFPDTTHPDYDTQWDGDLDKWEAAGRTVHVYRTMKARELWHMIIQSAWASAEPGMLFLERVNKMANSWYFAPLIGVNPCGEEPLPGNGVCNLGAINLSKFYDDSHQDVDWDALRQTVHYAVRFLDNVVDINPYFFEKTERQQLSERRVGLGTMGLAELMIRLGIRYGSDESLKFIDRLYGFITTEAYLMSAEIAAEKGAFPEFNGKKFLQSGFMKAMPEHVRKAIRQKGIRNVTLVTVAPTGTTGTLVNTSTGVEPFFSWSYYRKSRLGVHEEQVPLVKEWFEQHPGETKLPDHFVTAMDLAPEDHVRVQGAVQRWIDSSISKCVVGDTLILTADGLQAIEEVSDLREVDKFETIDITVATPKGKSRATAFYYNGIQPTVKLSLSYGFEIEGTLNHPIRVLQADGSRPFKLLSEIKIGDVVPLYGGQRLFGRPQKHLPEYSGTWNVTNTKKIIIPTYMTEDLAYLLGCITSEGNINRNGVGFTNGDRQLVERVAALFETIFGVHCLIERDQRRESLYYVRANSRALRHWLVNDLGLIPGARNKRIPACILAAAETEISHFLRGLFLDAYMTLDGKMFGIGLANRQLLQQLQLLLLNFGIVARLHKTGPFAWTLTVAGEDLSTLAAITAFDEIWKNERIAKRDEGRQIKPRQYAKLLPGSVSASLYEAVRVNDSSLRRHYVGRESNYQRVRVALMRRTKIGRDDAREVYQAFEDTSSEYLHNFFNEDLPGCIYVEVKAIQSGFAEVFDITVPDGHEFIANGICNHNTANLPNNYTVEQVGKLYEYMYDLGCKGGTVYRDGSRDEQVLMLKADDAADKKASPNGKPVEQVATPHRVYPRPRQLAGVTVSRKTPFGTAFITMNSDEHGNPFEVFITVGKAGSDLQADAEGLGRMISLQLRTTAPQNRKEMLKLVVDQLQGIGGSRAVGLGPNRVISLPDAVAGALMEHYFPANPEQLKLPMINGGATEQTQPVDQPDASANGVPVHGIISGADICPECGLATLVRIEGCEKCLSCAYSRC